MVGIESSYDIFESLIDSVEREQLKLLGHHRILYIPSIYRDVVHANE